MSDDPTQSLLQNRSDVEISCTAVDDSVELTLFRNRKTNSIAKRIIRLNALECEQADPDENIHQLSCFDRLKHPCDNTQILSPRLRKLQVKGNELIRSIVLPVLSRWESKLHMLLLASLILGFVSLVSAVTNAKLNPHNVFTPVRITMAVCTILLSLMHLIIKYLHNRKANYGIPDCDRTGNCKSCLKLCSLSMWELYCILLKEAFEYPIIVCTIIENATTKSFQTPSEKWHLCYFVFCILKFAFEVYFIRLLVICYNIHSLRQLRQGSTQAKYRLLTGHGLMLEVNFSFLVFFQILSQILMLATLWVKVKCINQFVQDQEEVNISLCCWILITSGFILPILGTLAFYLPWHKQIQIYPVEFMIDLFNTLQKCGITSISQNARENLKKINDSIVTAMKQGKQSKRSVFMYAIVLTPKLALWGLLFLIPLSTTLVGIWNGPTIEHNNGTHSCDIVMEIQTINGTAVSSAVLWSVINFTAFYLVIQSNILTLGIIFSTIFFYAFSILILPFSFIFSVVIYCVFKCIFPQDKDCTLTSCLCICIAILPINSYNI